MLSPLFVTHEWKVRCFSSSGAEWNSQCKPVGIRGALVRGLDGLSGRGSGLVFSNGILDIAETQATSFHLSIMMISRSLLA